VELLPKGQIISLDVGGVNLPFFPIGTLQRSGLSFHGTTFPEYDATGYLDHSPSLALFVNLSVP
jgi:hypothetical protein